MGRPKRLCSFDLGARGLGRYCLTRRQEGARCRARARADRFTTRRSSSPTADGCVCIAKRSISAPVWPAKRSESRKSTTASGSSASWITILVISIWRKKLCSPSTIPLGQKCYLCLRYILLPMSPGRTLEIWLLRYQFTGVANKRASLAPLRPGRNPLFCARGVRSERVLGMCDSIG